MGRLGSRGKFAEAEAGDSAGGVADGADEEDSLGLRAGGVAVFEVAGVAKGKSRVDVGVARGGEAVDKKAKVADCGDGLAGASVGSGDRRIGGAVQSTGGAEDEVADHLGGERLAGVGGFVGPEIDVQRRALEDGIGGLDGFGWHFGGRFFGAGLSRFRCVRDGVRLLHDQNAVLL